MRKMYMDRLAACREDILKHKGEMGIMRKKGVVIHKEMEDQREEVHHLHFSSGVLPSSVFNYAPCFFPLYFPCSSPSSFSVLFLPLPLPHYFSLTLARTLPLHYAFFIPFIFFTTVLNFCAALLYCTTTCTLNSAHTAIIKHSSSHPCSFLFSSFSLPPPHNFVHSSLPLLLSHRLDHFMKEKVNCAVR